MSGLRRPSIGPKGFAGRVGLDSGLHVIKRDSRDGGAGVEVGNSSQPFFGLDVGRRGLNG